jgi:hypothetical protein
LSFQSLQRPTWQEIQACGYDRPYGLNLLRK